jgi:hypothetical protein
LIAFEIFDADLLVPSTLHDACERGSEDADQQE